MLSLRTAGRAESSPPSVECLVQLDWLTAVLLAVHVAIPDVIYRHQMLEKAIADAKVKLDKHVSVIVDAVLTAPSCCLARALPIARVQVAESVRKLVGAAAQLSRSSIPTACSMRVQATHSCSLLLDACVPTPPCTPPLAANTQERRKARSTRPAGQEGAPGLRRPPWHPGLLPAVWEHLANTLLFRPAFFCSA